MVPNKYSSYVLKMNPWAYLPLDADGSADASRYSHSVTQGGSANFTHAPIVSNMSRAGKYGTGAGFWVVNPDFKRWLGGYEDEPFTIQGWFRPNENLWQSFAWHSAESDGIVYNGPTSSIEAKIRLSDNSYSIAKITVEPLETYFCTWTYDGSAHTLMVNDLEPVTVELTDEQKALGFKTPATTTVRFGDSTDTGVAQACALYRKAVSLDDHKALYALGREVEGWHEGNTFAINGSRRAPRNVFTYDSDLEWSAGFLNNVTYNDGYLSAIFDETGTSEAGDWTGFIPTAAIDSYVDSHAFWESEGAVDFSVSTDLGATWVPLSKGRRFIPTGLTLPGAIGLKIEFSAGETSNQRVDYFKARFYDTSTVNTERGDVTYSGEVNQAHLDWLPIDANRYDGAVLIGEGYIGKETSGGDNEWAATELLIRLRNDTTDNRTYYDERNAGADSLPYVGRFSGNIGIYNGTSRYFNGVAPGTPSNIGAGPYDYIHLIVTRASADTQVHINENTDITNNNADIQFVVVNHFVEAPDAATAKQIFESRFGRPSIGASDVNAIAVTSDTAEIDTRVWTAIGS